MLQVRRIFADGGELAVELVKGDRRHGFGIVEVEFDLALSGEGMDHIGNRAHHVDGIEHAYGLRTVGQGDGHAVILLHADGAQGAGAFMDGGHSLAIRGVRAHEIIGDELRALLGDALHGFNHAAAEIIKVCGDAVHIGHPRGLYGFGLGKNHGVTSLGWVRAGNQ